MSVSRPLLLSLACSVVVACSSSTASNGMSQVGSAAGSTGAVPSGGSSGSGTGSVGTPGSAGTGISLNIDAGADDPADSGTGDGTHIIATLLSAGGSGSADAGTAGGSGGASAGSAGSASTNGNCGNILVGVARDFRREDEAGSNPDFESPTFWGNDITPNLVAAMLGADQKPVYASQCELGTAVVSAACPYGAETTTKTNFDQWYRDTPGINLPFEISLYLAPQPGGLFTFQSLHYFPLDNTGYGNSGVADDKMMHNFGFTTEIHTQFSYNGGETFQFQGDDDVWVFINGKLTVDLGGLHPRMLGKVSLDDSATTLGLQKGNTYPLDLFHAERHTDKSTFRIDTNLSFVNCGSVPSIPK
jgi:fibro-slime domain-containing protein